MEVETLETVSRFYTHNLSWFVPRLLGPLLHSRWCQSDDYFIYANALVGSIKGLPSMAEQPVALAEVTRIVQDRELMLTAIPLLIRRGADICDVKGLTNVSLHELSDSLDDGLLEEFAERDQVFPLGDETEFNHGNQDHYRLLEVSVCGLISLLQRAFIHDIVYTQGSSLHGLTVPECVAALEASFASQIYAACCAAFLVDAEPVVIVDGKKKQVVSSHYYDAVYGELTDSIRDAEQKQGNDAKAKSTQAAALDSVAIMRYSACLAAAFHVWDEPGMLVVLEFFTEWCSVSVLELLPEEVLEMIGVLGYGEIGWTQAMRGSSIQMLAAVFLTRAKVEPPTSTNLTTPPKNSAAEPSRSTNELTQSAEARAPKLNTTAARTEKEEEEAAMAAMLAADASDDDDVEGTDAKALVVDDALAEAGRRIERMMREEQKRLEGMPQCTRCDKLSDLIMNSRGECIQCFDSRVVSETKTSDLVVMPEVAATAAQETVSDSASGNVSVKTDWSGALKKWYSKGVLAKKTPVSNGVPRVCPDTPLNEDDMLYWLKQKDLAHLALHVSAHKLWGKEVLFGLTRQRMALMGISSLKDRNALFEALRSLDGDRALASAVEVPDTKSTAALNTAPSAELQFWSCSKCKLQNPDARSKCSLCSHPRAISASSAAASISKSVKATSVDVKDSRGMILSIGQVVKCSAGHCRKTGSVQADKIGAAGPAKTRPLILCKCGTVAYCSRQCQAIDFRNRHKASCTK